MRRTKTHSQYLGGALVAAAILWSAPQAHAACEGDAPDGTFNPGAGEECDDGNLLSNDACTSECLLPVCGDGSVLVSTVPGVSERCDDDNTTPGDGCSASCTVEDGWACAPPLILDGVDVQSIPGGTEADFDIAPDGLSVVQNANTSNPAVGYIAEAEGFSAIYTFDITVENDGTVGGFNDDDFIGFVLGYGDDEITDADADYLLVDWKQDTQGLADCGGAATPGRRGIAVSHVTGASSSADGGNFCDFWSHRGVVEEIFRPTGAGSLGDVGWVDLRTYRFVIRYSPRSLVITVDGVEQLNVAPDPVDFPAGFPMGTVGFYGLSQSAVRYEIVTPTAPSICNIAPTAADSTVYAVTGDATASVPVPSMFMDPNGGMLDEGSIRVVSVMGDASASDPGSGADAGEIDLMPDDEDDAGMYAVTYEFCDDHPVIPQCGQATVTVVYNDPPNLMAPRTDVRGGEAMVAGSDIIMMSDTGDVNGGGIDTTSLSTSNSAGGTFGSTSASAGGGTCTITGGAVVYAEPDPAVGTTDSCFIRLCESLPGPTGTSATGRACSVVEVVFVLDSDGDGVPNSTEEDVDDPDPDMDGVPAYLDLDSDGDGILDSVEGIADPDMDGEPAFLDLDSDGDGIVDAIEGHDADMNGVADAEPVDRDTDGDGLDDAFDPDCADAEDCMGTIGVPAPVQNSDDDAIPDFLDDDADGDGVPDAFECGGGECSNVDGDDFPDYLDTDTDGDGIDDAIEAHDVDGDGVADVVPVGRDTDGDGVDDAFDSDCAAAGDCPDDVIGVIAALPNRDGEGPADWRDNDDDGDGILTLQEVMDAVTFGDPDDDDVPAYLDTDSDGDMKPDVVEAGFDLDGDDIPDYLDPDSGPQDTDMDGIRDGEECADLSMPDDCVDTDEDGTPDWMDPDDDGDGINTIDERPSGMDRDTDMNSTPDHLDDDDDGDGLPTMEECPDPSDCRATDADDRPDYLDTDDDNDGILTADEVEDAAEHGNDIDEDGNPNWLDTDSDGDGMPDEMEGRTADMDEDGIPDYLDPNSMPADADMDGLPDDVECDDPSMPMMCPDSDMDGTPDFMDEDDDNDTILTRDELDDGLPRNTDGDENPDHLDPDDDNDGIPTETEAMDSMLPDVGDDVDDDGDVNWRDTDSDADGIDDGDEGLGDGDGDGIPDYLDPDQTVGGYAGGSCTVGGGSTSVGWLLAIVGLIGLRRRRR